MTNELHRAQTQLQEAQAEMEKALQQAAGHDANITASDRAGEPGEKPHGQTHKKGPGGGRGVETMFRGAYRVQMDLTGLADHKANMMISINSIIMSIILGTVAPKLDANPWLLLPTLVLLAGNLVSIIYSIQAARPRIFRQPINLQNLRRGTGNLLFFGNFSSLSEDEFVQGMCEMMEEKELVYDTMIRNIYGLGVVLNRKFALLQAAYSSFMVALILGVSSFMVVFIWLSQHPKTMA